MRYHLLVLVALTGLAVASCGENPPPTSQTTPTGQLTPTNAAPGRDLPRQTSASASAGQGSPVSMDEPVPPKDAQWTMLCYSVRGPTHVAAAREFRVNLVKKTHRTDWYVTHSADQSNLYFGFYRTVSGTQDAAEVHRAKSDLEMVKTIQADDGSLPFLDSAFVEMSSPDPNAKPEWDLANVDLSKDPQDPTRAYWTLQIMAFKGIAQRKEAAVEVVQELRKEGVQAYYYHGETVSSVCVGAWPPSAIRAQSGDGDHAISGYNHTIVISQDPNQKVPEMDDEGHPIVAVTPRVEVVDPTLEAAMKRWPDSSVNGLYTVHRTATGKQRDPSFLVVIPRAKGNGLYDAGTELPPPPPGRGNGQVAGDDQRIVDPSVLDATSGAPAPHSPAPMPPQGTVRGETPWRGARPPGSIAATPPERGSQPQPPADPGFGRLRRVGE